MVHALVENARTHCITLFLLDDRGHGILHVMVPDQGITQPGLLMVCGDSHTATHGALGALAFGIGASEVTHVLATQTLWQMRPKAMRVTVNGRLGAGVTGKDVILAIIARIGAAGGVGHVIEYAGEVFRAMSMEAGVLSTTVTSTPLRHSIVANVPPPQPIIRTSLIRACIRKK